MEESMPTGTNAGRSPASPDSCEKSYSIYRKCSECPVFIYRDATCNDNLKALIREGEPPEEELRHALEALTMEFAELSGNADLRSANKSVGRITACRCRITALSLALMTSDSEQAQALFRQYGWGKLPDDKREARAEAKIKELRTTIAAETSRMEKRATRGSRRKTTEADFNHQIAIISKWTGFHLSDRMMLAELAGYIREFDNSIKSTIYERNHKKY